MPLIRFPCPNCSREMKVEEKHAGKRARCPKCAASFTVPEAGVELFKVAPLDRIPWQEELAERIPPAPPPVVLPHAEPDDFASSVTHSELPTVVSSYIRQNLMSGERLVAITRIHPMTLLFPAVFTVFFLSLGLIGIAIGREIGLPLVVIGGPMTVAGAILLVAQMIACLCTEFSCTDRRILIKSGLITTRLREMPLAKVEALLMEQGLFGKIFGYGTLIFKGSGGTRRECGNIEAPFDFYRKVQEQVAVAQQPK